MLERGGQSAQVGEGRLKEVEKVFKHWDELRDAKMPHKEI
jgi:hypothetical protein